MKKNLLLHNCLKLTTYKLYGKDFIFSKKIDFKILLRLRFICENMYIIETLTEDECCDKILLSIKELIKNQNRISKYRKLALENNIIQLIMTQNWIRENNWFKKHFNNLKKNYYDENFIFIIDFIYNFFYQIR